MSTTQSVGRVNVDAPNGLRIRGMRRIDEIDDRIAGLFNGDFYGHRREILLWARKVNMTCNTALAFTVLWTAAKMCVGESIHRALLHEDWFASKANAKLTEYLWLINPDEHWLQDFHTAGLSQFGVPKLLVALRMMGLTLSEIGIEETPELIRMSEGEACTPRCLAGCAH